MSNFVARRFRILAGLAACACLVVQPARAQAQAPDGCYPISGAVLLNYSQPLNIDFIKKQLIYYRCSQYDADVAAVLADAQQWVKLRAPQVTNPAIVLDIDETSLSNWTRIFKDDFAYFANGACHLNQASEACGDEKWQASEQAPALGPTRDLYNLARCNGAAPTCRKVEVFFITGRRDTDLKVDGKTPTEWTLENLAKAGYTDLSPDHLHMRPAASTGNVAPYKSAAREEIEKKFNVTIIVNVGDQESDLAGGHAERTFKMPNPFYFIP
jgi:acid phosphatase